MYKRKSFEHERELRALTMDPWPLLGSGKDAQLDLNATATDAGRLIVADLNKLIENIFVSPLAPDWYFNAVVAVTDKFKLKCKPNRSSLEADPFY